MPQVSGADGNTGNTPILISVRGQNTASASVPEPATAVGANISNIRNSSATIIDMGEIEPPTPSDWKTAIAAWIGNVSQQGVVSAGAWGFAHKAVPAALTAFGGLMVDLLARYWRKL